ncbi:receptor activity-modifying protein 2 [Hyla sarda]|uniref:receptor activity-modifying protein 2 n=1 Tax=Hyla sarda TaxID=327740 RepID=UPI0024C31800|nr:receptor activity-modifying protein 2 [Hyla sarda]
MERRIVCTLTSTLCLFTWALGSLAAVENVTQPTVNVSHPTGYYYPNALTYDEDVYICWSHFGYLMFHLGQEHWCNWKRTVRLYAYLQECLETTAENRSIAFPNELAHHVILRVHMDYFKNCSLLSEELMDPPDNILFGLIFAPICLIPFLVTLVVYKSNTSKPQT